MSGWTYACLVAGLILLAAPAGALIPDDITIAADTPWVTAGSGETATVTVQVLNNTPDSNTPVAGVAVDFTLDGDSGGISPAQAVTDDNGTATAVFTPGTRSGDVMVTATVGSLAGSIDLHIDHAAPYRLAGSPGYRPKVTVGGTTAIIVRMVDRYDNVVDSRRVAENVTFTVGSPGGGATFVGGDKDEITVPVDADGNATATLRVDTVEGENIVFIQPPASVRSEYIFIKGVADGMPFSITQMVEPASASVPADSDKVIEFTYTLFDEYGNLAEGQGLWVNASIQRGNRPEERETALLYSNSHGQVMITYGPEDSVGIATITATAAANASVSVSQEAEFTSTDPVDMLLSASPQFMPSRDVNLNSVAQLRAKVMDIKGNPVEGETVTFKILSVYVGGYNQTVAPYLETEGQTEATATTTKIESGRVDPAVVRFYAGSFTTDKKAPGWNANATGTATVRATWGNISRDIVLTWKNYPYLSVETSVSPETVAVNGTVDVTIRLKGDGYKLQPDPIDAVLCTDRSGSMLKDYPDRMVKAMEASELFNTQMNYPRDRLGLVSFGKTGYTDLIGYGYRTWLGGDNTDHDDFDYRSNHYPSDPKYYANYATLDLPMSDDPSTINATVKQTVPDWGTPMRSGIYRAINELNVSGRADAVKAVIVLSDGDYNHYGDPLARGDAEGSWDPSKFDDLTTKYLPFDGLGEGRTSNQNMSIFATNNDIRIYSIAFARDITSGGKDTLRVLAESTGGRYYYADTGDDLAQVYTDIAGELKTEAGVDTNMNVVFENVEVNGTPESGAEVFDYVYALGESTNITSWIQNETGYYPIVGPHTRNDTLNWTATPPHLPFNIGTIHLDQTWETTFRLKVKWPEGGNIKILGGDSMISFNNGTDVLPLPDTFITAVPDLNNTGLTSAFLDVEFTEPGTGSGPYTDVAPLTWKTTYNGTGDVVIALSSSPYEDGRGSSTFFTKTLSAGTFSEDVEEVTNSTLMDIRRMTPGQYWITVTASAPDASSAEDTTTLWAHTKDSSLDYIKVE